MAPGQQFSELVPECQSRMYRRESSETLQSVLDLAGKVLREEMEESHLSICSLLDRQMPSLWRAGPLPKRWKIAGGEGGVTQVPRPEDAACHGGKQRGKPACSLACPRGVCRAVQWRQPSITRISDSQEQALGRSRREPSVPGSA